MRNTLLVAIASAAIGAATAVLLTRPTPAPVRGPGPARLGTRDLEAAFVRALETVGFGRQAPSRSVPEAPAPAPAAADAAATPIRGPDGNEPLPAPNLPEIESLKSFDDAPELRRTWLFRPEREVIAWLGMPQRAFAYGGGERWVYKLPDKKERVLEFHRGRLINIYD